VGRPNHHGINLGARHSDRRKARILDHRCHTRAPHRSKSRSVRRKLDSGQDVQHYLDVRKKRPEKNMTFTPLGLTPLIGVWDMPTALAFYRDLLGFAVVFASPEVETAEGRFSHYMWLRFGAAEIMLNTQYDSNERPTQPPAKRSQDAVFYIGCADVDLAYQELTDRGLKAKPPKMASYGLKLFSVEDPDGYTIVFQEVR
jgi:glyoxylase I family protein